MCHYLLAVLTLVIKLLLLPGKEGSSGVTSCFKISIWQGVISQINSFPREVNLSFLFLFVYEQGNRGPFVMETVKADDKAKLGEPIAHPLYLLGLIDCGC